VTAALLILTVFSVVFWLVFFKFKWLRLSPGWGIFSAFFVLHVFLVFVIGMRFVTPYSTNAIVVQHTIQLIPRLPDPTLVTAVLVEEGVPVKKGQPLFQFDRRPYEYKVEQLEAQLRASRANVEHAQAGAEAADAKVVSARDGVGQAQAAVDQAKAVTTNAIASVEFNGNTITGLYADTAGTQKGFRTFAPPAAYNPGLVDLLKSHSVQIKAVRESAGAWTMLLIQWAPIILMIGFWMISLDGIGQMNLKSL